ncbi:hypothetical protein Tco_1089653 [Tanacetum coccineum]
MNPIIIPIFSTPTRNNTHLLRTNRIRLPQSTTIFPPQPTQPQFKVPQAKDPCDGRRKLKKTGKQPVVDLDEDDDDDVEAKRANTCWNRKEEILLAETWIEHSQNAAEPIDEDNLTELFGPDPKDSPASKPRDYKRKCDAAKAAYQAKQDKELGMLQCRELEFLMIDPSSLPPQKRAIIEKNQAKIMKKYSNA